MATSKRALGSRCKAIRKNGSPCNARSLMNGFCAFHGDPSRAAALGRRSGQVRPHVERDDQRGDVPAPTSAGEPIRALGDVFADVRNRRLDPSVARTLAQVSMAILKGFEVGELAERIEKLEVERRGFTTTDRAAGKSIAGESDAAGSMEIFKADAGAT